MEAEAASPGPKRPLTVDDLLRLEELGEVALSPDGQWLAYVLKRPRLTARFHKYDFLDGGDRGDVFVVKTSGGTPEKLTEGTADGAGYWAPSWSPDGQRLVMLSTKGGNVHLWGCEMRSRSLMRLCSRPVDTYPLFSAPHVWVSGRGLLVPTLPEGRRPIGMSIEVQAAEVAMREWPKAWQGAESTRSALESGSHLPFDERPQGELMLVDAVTARERAVMRGFFRELRISPDKRHVALLRQQDVARPRPTELVDWPDRAREEVVEVLSAGGAAVATLDAIEQPLSGSLRWSPDSAELALIGRADESAQSPRRVFRYRLDDGSVEPVTDASVEPTSIVWTREQRILALAKPSRDAGGEAEGRADWWLLESDREPRNITAGMAAVPPRLVALPRGEVFVGLAAGALFRLDVADDRCESLTETLDEKFSWLVWPPPQKASDGRTFTRLILAVDEGDSFAWRSLDLTSGELSALTWPCAKGWLVHFAAEHKTAVPAAVDRTGARLWLSRPAFEEHRSLLETNTWLQDIAEGELAQIDYRGLDGDELKGWLILPVGYEQGRRYPLISWVYPGAVFSETPPARTAGLTSHHSLNCQLLAARGYAVLLPSMPLQPEGEASDPYLELTKGVLPAVDKAIELGIADPDRLGVIGQSNGGYATYGLITQTNRFNAAIALAGFADLTSLYGQFDPRDRYDDYAHEDLFRMSLSESGQLRMGGPPWEDPERYVRNSPLFHADRVETPLLIIQGDMDYVPLVQGEEFFTALYRQGKRARFARYWGEGHVFQGPANITQMWQDIYGWFKEFLKPSTDDSQL